MTRKQILRTKFDLQLAFSVHVDTYTTRTENARNPANMKIQPVSRERLKNFSQRNYYARMFENLPTMTLSALRDCLKRALEDENTEAAKRVSDAIDDAIKNP